MAIGGGGGGGGMSGLSGDFFVEGVLTDKVRAGRGLAAANVVVISGRTCVEP